MTMETSKKHEPQMTFQAENPPMKTHPVTSAGCAVADLLEDSGNCRQIIKQELSLHLLNDSLFSEQQKLRHVLDWAHSFLSSGSEVHHKFCRADSLILAKKEHKESPAHKHSPAAKYHHPVSCTAGGNEVFEGQKSVDKLWQLQQSRYEKSESNNHLCAYKPPVSDDPCIPFSFTPKRGEVTWPENKETPENMEIMELQDTTDEQTPSIDLNCRTNSLYISNQKQRPNLSPRNPNQTLASDGARCLIKESTSCWSNNHHKKSMMLGTASNLKLSYKTAPAQSERYISGHQVELSKVKVEAKAKEETEDARTDESKREANEEQEYSSALVVCAESNVSSSEPERMQEHIEKTSNLSFSCHFKMPPTLTVYERYQLCVDQLHHLRVRRSQPIEMGCYMESPAKEKKISEEIAAPVEAPAPLTSCFELKSSTTNPEIKKVLHKAGSKRVTAAGITKERSSDVISRNQDSSKYNRSRATLAEQGRTKHCDDLTVKKKPVAICAENRPVCQRNTVTSNTHLDLDSHKCGDLMKGTAGGITSIDRVINTSMEHLGTAPGDDVSAVEESAALTTNPGWFPKRIRQNPGVKRRQSGVKGQKKKAGGRGVSLRLCEKSGAFMSSLTEKEILQRPQSSGIIQHAKRNTPEDKVKPTSAYGDTHKYLPPTETHTPPHNDTRPMAPASGTWRCEQTAREYSVCCCHYACQPAGVPVCDGWLCLPDEVWLSILSLLPHSDLCRVLQVCSRLHTLASDHTLWKNLRIENASLTERWLLCVCRRRPRSLCLYSCSGLSLTSCGLETFFTLCGNFLEEVKVTSCTGPGLHGDQVLPLIGQLCQHVTSVDVSWSGATDKGVKALSDSCAGLRLKSVVLNGCHVTDDPLMKLIMKHKESLCRLEVFGCQFLTPSCLQMVYEMCPGLQHLNIGQVPKVNIHSLTVMTSQLRCLISLNLTGLQAVTDATVDTLLQNCELQSLSLSSCPGVTDLTLHSISKYTPCIRSLDVSGCKAVTDTGVQSLALGCRKLQQLDLSSTGTGNRGVTLLANYCGRYLHTVKLSFCHITLGNILKLCRRCKRLKMLHLYGSAHLPTEREIREVNTTVKVYPLPD